MAQTGPFVHEQGDTFFLKFESDGDTPRVFTVVNAYAYNAGGIIGSEKNGVAILDNGSEEFPAMGVIASDVHSGDRAAAARLFERFRTMSESGDLTWDQFKEAMKHTPNYRGNVDEIEQDLEVPYEGKRLNLIALGAIDSSDEPDIRTQDMIDADAADNDYSFPEMGRSAMIAEIMNHGFHKDGHYGDAFLSWNVKMGMPLDETGKAAGEEVDSDHDEAWKEYFEENESQIFDWVTEDMYSLYAEGLYTTYPGEDQGDYEFGLQGRSGGNLVLKSVDGIDLSFDSYAEVGEKLETLSDKELAQVFKAVRSLDADLTSDKLAADWAYQLNFHRTQKEEEWNMEMAPAPA